MQENRMSVGVLIVFLIIVGPGIKINNNPVELVDLYPTIMELVQMQTPKFVSGKSIVPLLENSENIVI